MTNFIKTSLIALIGLIGASSGFTIHDPESFFVDNALLLEENNGFTPFSDHEDGNLTVPQIIAKYGYPVEVHNVTTADGYILQLHRIPYGRNCGPAENKKVIFVQHGLLCDSSNWVMNGANKSLAFRLADACYDVWLGNARGNTYSKRHVTLDPHLDKEAYWDFSYHEMGIYDLPANFDYMMELTGTDGLYYVGHSMGTTMFWICMAEVPQYNSKIKLMNALAPVAHTEHMISPIRLIAPFSTQIEWLLKMFGLHEFLPSNDFLELISQQICDENSPIQPICANFLFILCGFNPDQLDTSLLPVLLGHLPAGASVRTVVHYAQGVPSGEFRQYDFGTEKNMEKYGQPTPPDYDLTKITAPIALYWGENDWMGAKADTLRIAELLPNIQRMFRIQDELFNHLDFLVAKQIQELINNPQQSTLLLLGLLGLVALASSKSLQNYNPLADNEDAKLSVPELIVKYGYPVEVHNITTADGYILTVHRIPYGKKCGPGEGKRVIFLQHGLLGDSANWIIAGPEKSLGYNLADECYDVWMGNYRGNTYSKRHVALDPVANKEAFWSFSWNELGTYDLPAAFDYVLENTGTDGLYYVGHSMGTTGFWVCMSERPEYNSKIKLMNAYAPVSYTEHMLSPIALIAPFSGQVEELMPTILGHVPAGSSVRNLVHYAQGVNSGLFRKYDHGRAGNLEAYGQETPPEYDISKITAPVALWWGENDWLGVKSDVYRLAEQLPNIQLKYRINHDKYNHLDFLWAKDNVDLINKQTIEFMKNF
ncbi:Lipase 3 [Orchesella cincta]|uniref:Lipase 3 n=1 Tax=Orchesella cincta TaxID=48709 RepID=A0A1D2MVW5_ORCCI|nr:Lipase 3 [Orchesella cincta]